MASIVHRCCSLFHDAIRGAAEGGRRALSDGWGKLYTEQLMFEVGRGVVGGALQAVCPQEEADVSTVREEVQFSTAVEVDEVRSLVEEARMVEVAVGASLELEGESALGEEEEIGAVDLTEPGAEEKAGDEAAQERERQADVSVVEQEITDDMGAVLEAEEVSAANSTPETEQSVAEMDEEIEGVLQITSIDQELSPTTAALSLIEEDLSVDLAMLFCETSDAPDSAYAAAVCTSPFSEDDAQAGTSSGADRAAEIVAGCGIEERQMSDASGEGQHMLDQEEMRLQDGSLRDDLELSSTVALPCIEDQALLISIQTLFSEEGDAFVTQTVSSDGATEHLCPFSRDDMSTSAELSDGAHRGAGFAAACDGGSLEASGEEQLKAVEDEKLLHGNCREDSMAEIGLMTPRSPLELDAQSESSNDGEATSSTKPEGALCSHLQLMWGSSYDATAAEQVTSATLQKAVCSAALAQLAAAGITHYKNAVPLYEIGKGGCATVHHASTESPNGIIVFGALKCAKAQEGKVLRGDEQLFEALAAYACQGPDVIQFLGVTEHEGRLALLFKEVDSPPAWTAYRGPCPATPSELQQRVMYAYQSAKGVAHVHKCKKIHRDIKPDNFFNDGGIAKLGDFGFTLSIEEAAKGGTPGSPAYLDPYVRRKGHHI